MKPIAMPETWFPGAPRRTIGGEKGTEPAEYVIQPDDDYRLSVSTLVQVDPEEIKQIQEHGYLLLTLYGGELPWRIVPSPSPDTAWEEATE